jgi:asparagine synthase (glutamine-hydrolysing)
MFPQRRIMQSDSRQRISDATRLDNMPNHALVLRRTGGVWSASGPTSYSAPCNSVCEGAAPFLRWCWQDHSLDIATDAFGIVPAFYWIADDVFAITPSIRDLLEAGAPDDLDDAAIATFLRLGFYVGSDTPFSSIKALPPRPVVDISGRRPAISSSRPTLGRNQTSRKAVMDEYVTLFRKAIAARSGAKPVVLPLSGGRDSRHILLELVEQHRPIRTCVTVRHFPPRGDDDVVVAASVAKAVGVDHCVPPAPSSRIAAEIRKNLLTNFCTDEHGHFMSLVDYLQGQEAQVFDGIAGDVLSAAHFLSPETLKANDAGVSGMTAYMLDQYDRSIEHSLRRILSKQAHARFSREKAEARIQEEARHDVNAPDPMSAFFLWNRTRREIALSSCALCPSGTTVEMPYLDEAIYSLFSSLDVTITMDHRLHEEVIASTYPKYSGLGYERKELTKSAPWHFRTGAVAFGARLLGFPWQDWLNPTYVLGTIALELKSARGEHLWYMSRVLPLLQAEAARRRASQRA